MNGQTNASFWAVKTHKGNLLLCHIMLHYIPPAPGLCCYILPYFHINSQMNSILFNFNLTNKAKKKMQTDFPKNAFQIFTHDSDDDDNDDVDNNENDDDDDDDDNSNNNNNNCNNNINKDGNNDDDYRNEIKNSLHLIILFV